MINRLLTRCRHRVPRKIIELSGPFVDRFIFAVGGARVRFSSLFLFAIAKLLHKLVMYCE